MKKIISLLIITASFGLAGCNEKPAPTSEEKANANAQRKLMKIAPREMPVQKPYKEGERPGDH